MQEINNNRISEQDLLGMLDIFNIERLPAFCEYLDLDALMSLSSTNGVFRQIIRTTWAVWEKVGRNLWLPNLNLPQVMEKLNHLRSKVFFKRPDPPISEPRYLSCNHVVTFQKARDTLVVWEALADLINGERPSQKYSSDKQLLEEAKKFPKWFEEHREFLSNRKEITLYLQNSNLQFLPEEISQLENLFQLRLDNNHLREEGLVNLPKSLRVLSLQNNQIRKLPGQFLELKALRNLNLSSNQLCEEDSCNNLPENLWALFLNANHLKKVPFRCSQLRQLATFTLEENDLSNEGEYTNLPRRLDKLVLAKNKLSKVPAEFLNLKIGELDLSNNPFSGEGVYAYLPRTLKGLNLANHNLRKVPAILLELDHLRMLNLSENHLSEEEAYTYLPVNLTQLYLGRNQLIKVPEKVFELENLENLDLSHNQLKTVPATLSQFVRLNLFWLQGNQLEELPDEILARARRNMCVRIEHNPWRADFQARWTANGSLQMEDIMRFHF